MEQVLEELKSRMFRITKNKKLNVKINFDNIAKESRQEHNPHCSQILDYLCRILTVGSSGSEKKCITQSNKLSTRYC